MHSIRGLVFMLCCLALVSISIAGCGTAQPTESMILKVAQNSTAFSYFPSYVAQQQHFFKAQGLTLIPDPLPILGNGTRTTAAMAAGGIEVGVGTITDAFTLSRINAHLRIIGAFSDAFLIDLIVSKRFEQQTHLTERSPLAQKVKALVGKKIGISAPGSATDALITYLFRQQGLNDQRDVTKDNLGNVTPGSALAALATGRVDAVSFPTPAGQEAEAQAIGDLFISPVKGDVPSMQGMIYGVLYTTQQVIVTKPKAVQALIRAFAQAEAWIAQHPAQAAALLQKYLQIDRTTTTTVAQAAMSSVPQTPQVSQQGYTIANQFHVKAGLIALALAYNDLVDTSTINTALAQDKRSS